MGSWCEVADGYESVRELGRVFDDFRGETRDEIKWLRRWLVASLGTVVVTSIGSSFWAVFRL
jgi:hypothetical protein